MPRSKTKHKTKSAVGSSEMVRPLPPGEQEIGDRRDDAARVAGTTGDLDRRKYAEGVRDALAWVIGDLEDDLEV
jgi:hypothetical protein